VNGRTLMRAPVAASVAIVLADGCHRAHRALIANGSGAKVVAGSEGAT
jgi:hypothetical protein